MQGNAAKKEEKSLSDSYDRLDGLGIDESIFFWQKQKSYMYRPRVTKRHSKYEKRTRLISGIKKRYFISEGENVTKHSFLN